MRGGDKPVLLVVGCGYGWRSNPKLEGWSSGQLNPTQSYVVMNWTLISPLVSVGDYARD